jgi:hypothetical protein
MLVPALLTRMSSRPQRASVASTIAATDFSSVTSVSTAKADAPRASRSRTAARDFSAFRAAMTILAPAPAKPRAMPSPIPPLPPVTIATFPLKSNMLAPDVLRPLLEAR